MSTDDDHRFPYQPPRPADSPAHGAARTAPPQPPPAAPEQGRRGPRPVPPDTEYHRVLAGEKRRIGRGVLAIALVVVGLYASNIGLAVLAALADSAMGNTNPTFGGTEYTVLYHIGNLLSVALLIPWSMVVQRWLYGVRGASLHSVLSRFRFDVFGRALLVIGPLWLVLSLVGIQFLPYEQTQQSSGYLLGLFASTLVLAPLQSAGEEYGFRGLVFRVAGSWGRGPRTALFLGVLVSSLAFTLVHLSADLWFNVWCFSLAVALALITWRTGGLEVASVIHALNNTLTFLILTVLHADQNTGLERSAGTGSPTLLIPSATVLVIAAAVWLGTRRSGPATTPAGVPTDRFPTAQ